ncbi:EAL domain-containing protein [Methylobacillus gramineus]|uniref:bifunctional diguanylate cyclase/phosphodiesterase n=1 Tax=Methylobacillus gramineus TaxID=755169 RepID=UPI001CFF8F8B|nr:EAL domain-containing protein [Methylobacillus gramineus]MCB5184851.1 EAL domain-containing protein [Methylobacillus gramineus]
MYISSHQPAAKSRPIRYFLTIALIGLCYFALAQSAIQFGVPETIATFIWPPAGFALATLIIGGNRLLPGLLIGALFAEFSVGLPLIVAVTIAIGNIASAWLANYLLKHVMQFDPAMTRLRDLLAVMCLSALFSPVLGATVALSSLFLADMVHAAALFDVWLQWWMGDALSIILFTPAILACFYYEPIQWSRAKITEAIIFLVILVVIGAFAFTGVWLDSLLALEAKAFLVFPLVIWAALSFHQRGAAIASLFISITALWVVAGYQGYFSMQMANTDLLNYWLFVLVTVSTGVGLSGLNVGRLRVDTRLKNQLGLYNALINAQSDAGEGVVVIEHGKIAYANEAVWKIGGYDARDIPLGSDFLNLIHPMDRERVAQQYHVRMQGLESPSRYEAMGISKSGKPIPIEVAAANYRDGSEKVVVLIIDISSRKQAETALLQSQTEYRELVESVQAIVWRATPEGVFTFVSQEAEVLMGYPLADWTRSDTFWNDTIHPDDRDWVVEFCRAESAQLKSHVFDYRMIAADGRTVWVQDMVRVIPNRFGKPQELVGVMLDITARKAGEASLRLSKQVFENTAEGILIADSNRDILDVNQAYLDITGYERDETIGTHLRLLDEIGGEDDEPIGSIVELKGKWMGEILARKKSGEYYPEWVSISTLYDSNGILQNYVAVLSDISQRKQSEERLQFLATHDALTGLPNRSLLQERVELALLRAQRYQNRVGVLFIDLDRFKIINDTLGHQAGDMLLQETAKRLKDCLRLTDTVARQGGDEFVVLLEDFTESQYLSGVARKIMNTLAQPFILMNQELYISASIGISVYPEDGVDIFSLLKNADMAMYKAKDDGKNTFHFYSADSNTHSVDRLILENNLRRAMEREEFTLLYQAKLDVHGQYIVGAEALIRWNSAELGTISPQDFIPIAEETGLIIEIGAWVINQACKDAYQWQSIAGRPIRVGVNLSARQFREDSLREVISEALMDTGLTADCLELEITESMIMQNAEHASEILQHFRDLGTHVLIDDFGTGYSSLAYLKHFPIDSLKIDRSFVRDVPQDSDDAAITQAIIAMAHSLKIKVVAEGVENQAQLEFLRAQSCDQLQGYIFSRPLPAADFAGMLRFDTAKRAGRTYIKDMQLELSQA